MAFIATVKYRRLLGHSQIKLKLYLFPFVRSKQLSLALLPVLHNLAQLRERALRLHWVQPGAERGEWLVEGGTLHGVHRVVLYALSLAPDVGAVHDLLDGIWGCSCPHVGQHHNGNLLLLLVLLNVSLDVGQHVKAARIHGIVDQNECIWKLKVVAWQLLLLALQSGRVVDAQGLSGSAPACIHAGHVDILNGWMQFLQ